MGKIKKTIKKLGYPLRRAAKLTKPPRKLVKSLPWWQRWPVYLACLAVGVITVSWVIDALLPKVDSPDYGVSFSEPYAKSLGNNWQQNYLALLTDLNVKKVRLMSYWEDLEPQPGVYNFADLDWQVMEATKHGAQVSMAIGYRQPRWPECHEPSWAATLPIESPEWRSALYSYIKTVVLHYKNEQTVKSYQLENEAVNSLFGGCRGGNAPRTRLVYEFNYVKSLDPKKPVFMSLSDEHGLPFGGPVPDAYGLSIYRVVYSTTFPIHFYATYPITDWYHRLRISAITHLKHRPVFIHELQMEPWGSKPTEQLTIAEQNRSMSVTQMKKSLEFARKTGVKTQYLWGAEWWYWRLNHFQDPGPWNVIKQAIADPSKAGQ